MTRSASKHLEVANLYKKPWLTILDKLPWTGQGQQAFSNKPHAQLEKSSRLAVSQYSSLFSLHEMGILRDFNSRATHPVYKWYFPWTLSWRYRERLPHGPQWSRLDQNQFRWYTGCHHQHQWLVRLREWLGCEKTRTQNLSTSLSLRMLVHRSLSPEPMRKTKGNWMDVDNGTLLIKLQDVERSRPKLKTDYSRLNW